MKDYRGNLIETPFDILFILSRSLTVNVLFLLVFFILLFRLSGLWDRLNWTPASF